MTDHDNDPAGTPDDEAATPPESELWKKITGEAEMLRDRKTPVYLKQQIMDSLDDKAANDRLWKRLTGESEGLADRFPDEAPRPWYQKLFRKDK